MQSIIQITLVAGNLVLLLAYAWYKMFSSPLSFDEETKPNYPPAVDWLLELDESEIKISE